MSEHSDEAAVLGSVEALHGGLDHVDRVVEHHRAESGETTGQEINHHLSLDVLTKVLLGLLKHDKAHSLVGGLPKKSWDNTLVHSTEALLSHDSFDSVEHILVLWVSGELVVNEFSLESLLRGDHTDGLHGSSGQSAHEVVLFVFGCEYVSLHECVGTEAHLILGD